MLPSVRTVGGDHDAAAKAAKDGKLDYPHVFDGQGWGNAVAAYYRVHGIPQTYLLDENLKIVAVGLRGEALRSGTSPRTAWAGRRESRQSGGEMPDTNPSPDDDRFKPWLVYWRDVSTTR